MDKKNNNLVRLPLNIIKNINKKYQDNANLDPIYLYTNFLLLLILFGFLILIFQLPIQFMFLPIIFILIVSPFYSRKIYYSMIIFANVISFFIIYDISSTRVFTKQTFIMNSIQTLLIITFLVIIVSEILHWAIPTLLKAEAALKETQENYKDLIDNANSIILTSDKDGNIQSMNKYGLNFFGYSEKEIIGKNLIGTIIPEFDSNGKSTEYLLSEIVCSKYKFRSNLNENIKKNGSRVWIYWTDKIVKNLDGKVESFLSIGSDITELKVALNQIEKNIQYFSIGIDQIKNPLAVVRGIAELKIPDKKQAEKIIKQIDYINDITKRLDEGWHESEEVKKFLQNREMLSYLHEPEEEELI